MAAILNFRIFAKMAKRHFWGGEIFLKIANITFLRYPVRDRAKISIEIARSRTVKEIEANL